MKNQICVRTSSSLPIFHHLGHDWRRFSAALALRRAARLFLQNMDLRLKEAPWNRSGVGSVVPRKSQDGFGTEDILVRNEQRRFFFMLAQCGCVRSSEVRFLGRTSAVWTSHVPPPPRLRGFHVDAPVSPQEKKPHRLMSSGRL